MNLEYGHSEPPASDESRRAPGKKDTRKWCKGKVGREHTKVIILDTRYTYDRTCGRPRAVYQSLRDTDWYCHHEEACSTCGKILRWSIPKDECPTYNTTPDSDESVSKPTY